MDKKHMVSKFGAVATPNCIFFNGAFPGEILIKYNGVIVDCINDMDYGNFAIRYRLASCQERPGDNVIWKRRGDKMHTIIFDDTTHGISADWEHIETSNSARSLLFEENEYEELKNCLPEFMRKQGKFKFRTYHKDGRTILKFK